MTFSPPDVEQLPSVCSPPWPTEALERSIADEHSRMSLESALEDETIQPAIAPSPAPNPALKVFLSTFFTIFLAELGDKTQVTTLLMSAESQSPWIVFAGAGSALIATSLIGVLLGRWLASRVSLKTIETAAGAALLFIAVSLLWDVVNL